MLGRHGTGPRVLRASNPDFVFRGLRLGEELAEHFASADLFLFPSLDRDFGNVTLEAMASGVPTIAFDYGAARAYLRDREHGRPGAARGSGCVRCGGGRGRNRYVRRRAMGVAARHAVEPLRPECVARDFVGVLAGLTA